MTASIPLLLDVDTGIDDALAIAFALGSPAADLIAITTLAGNVNVDRTTGNTLSVLDWLGAPEIAVHRGASRALVRPHRDAAYFHDVDGLGGANLPVSTRAVGPDRGPAAIVRLANAGPGELSLVCLGPLTNLAIALNVEPGLPGLLRRVVVMGGAFRVPGNITPEAEFNVFADPEAAAQVFAAPFSDLTVIGLDVTHQTVLSRAGWIAAEGNACGGGSTALVVNLCRQAFEQRGLDRVFLHDPLAVAVALDPGLVETETAAIAVGTAETDRGRTRRAGPGRVKVAIGVDAERFGHRFGTAVGLPETTG